MSRLTEIANEDGWAMALSRSSSAALRRVRDSFTARHLRTTGFHVGRAPRLQGLGHMRIGANFSAGDNLWLEAVTAFAGASFAPQLVIGDNVSLSDRVHIACLSAITIGAGTLMGSGVLISDHTHGAYRGAVQSGPDTPPVQRPLHSSASVSIGRNVWIGDAVCVLAGACIGDGAIIAAGSIVTGAIPANTMARGRPARPVRQWNAATGQWVLIAAEDTARP